MFKTTRITLACFVLLAGIVLNSCNNYRQVLKSSDIRLKYKTAVELYEKGDFHRAMQLFDELLIFYRGNDTSEMINYYYAYCYYGEEDYLEAGYYFTKFSSSFPTSKYSEECDYMSAYCQYLFSPIYGLDQTISIDAIKQFQLFINEYPASSRVAKCNELIDELRAKLEKKEFETARLYYKIESYQAAYVAFKNVLKDYPDTRHKEDIYYYMLASSYEYAINSIETKKKERLELARDAYNSLNTSFPQSEYGKAAKSIMKNIEKELAKYANKDNTQI
ncbi:MAG TPA: outer membrane protein assembly factor BamD [Bacteroidales bacterium]|jgi:outer membrane protein assembly factor BamD|nr:outer membrane protein assembly factor BamD [Bacteroidales bacterium]HNZ42468.1 outer membrane protein assembly factor BamD [Bacteroidales bacterium]HPB25596.1 outer membrane protein assembly factor BamD [Bacteroidales bacterium]HPI29788.1 outer membrane protein assembly factor BamD [Bacteroidales bacterium]HQN16286.1 outer membrane protein assembly factor BamD [Bacteroidales bacterium]